MGKFLTQVLLLFLFEISWNEYELKPWYKHSRGIEVSVPVPQYYTVELTTHTIKLATQKDVDHFTGYDGPCRDNHDGPPHTVKLKDGTKIVIKEIGKKEWCSETGIISKDAFNIKVKEFKE